ncbi:MAG: YcgN family cysteine cluster protein [Alphaproteobacteria bacterium]|nr:YcgN family cysteine cluster protein [Alphaproteobacteria bacterium]
MSQNNCYLEDEKNTVCERLNQADNVEPFFWQKKSLEEMSETEWELLCSGCGKCCLHKINDRENKKTLFTNVACRFLDIEICTCKLYEHRHKADSGCRKINIESLKETPRWLPKTCAYQLLYEGKDLPNWHYLVSGSFETVHKAGFSIKGRTINKVITAENCHKYIIDWDDI